MDGTPAARAATRRCKPISPRASRSLTNFIFRDTVLQQPTSNFGLLPKTTTQALGFGAFVGRNWQWDDLVFSLEAELQLFQLLHTSTSGYNASRSRSGPGHRCSIDDHLRGNADRQRRLAAQGRVQFRARTGWAVGNFLPYVFGGVTVGRMRSFPLGDQRCHGTRRHDDLCAGITTHGRRSRFSAQPRPFRSSEPMRSPPAGPAVSALRPCCGAASSCAANGNICASSRSRTRSFRPTISRFGIGYKF